MLGVVQEVKSLQHYKIVVLQKLRETRLQKSTTLNEIFHHDNPALSKGVVDEMYRRGFTEFDEMPDKLIHHKESLIMSDQWCGNKTSHQPSKHVFPQEYRHIRTQMGQSNNLLKRPLQETVKFLSTSRSSYPIIK